ncbi:MAG: hypothetical protein MI923_17400, partial [Phycisphaerales bacterium]|nr:hypothetical protein [Phycisphaerales bacterium]
MAKRGSWARIESICWVVKLARLPTPRLILPHACMTLAVLEGSLHEVPRSLPVGQTFQGGTFGRVAQAGFHTFFCAPHDQPALARLLTARRPHPHSFAPHLGAHQAVFSFSQIDHPPFSLRHLLGYFAHPLVHALHVFACSAADQSAYVAPCMLLHTRSAPCGKEICRYHHRAKLLESFRHFSQTCSPGFGGLAARGHSCGDFIFFEGRYDPASGVVVLVLVT